MAMGLLYKNEEDIIYTAAIENLPNGKIEVVFTCDGGKHGAEEMLAGFEMTAKELLEILNKNHIE